MTNAQLHKMLSTAITTICTLTKDRDELAAKVNGVLLPIAKERDELRVAAKGAVAALSQNKTHPADIAAAKKWLSDAITEEAHMTPETELTLQQQWDKAAGDAHDALHRLVELQEAVHSKIEDVWDDDDGSGEEAREEEAEPATALDLPAALELVQAAEDVTLPAWA